jgi:hypothetical protein
VTANHKILERIRLKTEAVHCWAQLKVKNPAFSVYTHILLVESKKNKPLTRKFIFLFVNKISASKSIVWLRLQFAFRVTVILKGTSWRFIAIVFKKM